MVIDRINRALMKLIRRRAGSEFTIHLNSSGVQALDGSATCWSMQWSEIRRVTAFRSAGFLGESLVLALESRDDTRLVTEEHPGWHELIAAIPEYLSGAMRYERWALDVAWGDDSSLTVYARQ